MLIAEKAFLKRVCCVLLAMYSVGCHIIQPADFSAAACVDHPYQITIHSDLVCCEYLFFLLLIEGFLSGVTIMLSITIFATIVGEMLPVSDATPLIG